MVCNMIIQGMSIQAINNFTQRNTIVILSQSHVRSLRSVVLHKQAYPPNVLYPLAY